jgi:hypothetical protein
MYSNNTLTTLEVNTCLPQYVSTTPTLSEHFLEHGYVQLPYTMLQIPISSFSTSLRLAHLATPHPTSQFQYSSSLDIRYNTFHLIISVARYAVSRYCTCERMSPSPPSVKLCIVLPPLGCLGHPIVPTGLTDRVFCQPQCPAQRGAPWTPYFDPHDERPRPTAPIPARTLHREVPGRLLPISGTHSPRARRVRCRKWTLLQAPSMPTC